ncbi:hypothetical protein CDD83_2507 [Cordyceps sp. RAO-2017]|nr:hypothetical protein CDD83_2507 [Cordyceps sp. RAO-2017]
MAVRPVGEVFQQGQISVLRSPLTHHRREKGAVLHRWPYPVGRRSVFEAEDLDVEREERLAGLVGLPCGLVVHVFDGLLLHRGQDAVPSPGATRGGIKILPARELVLAPHVEDGDLHGDHGRPVGVEPRMHRG